MRRYRLRLLIESVPQAKYFVTGFLGFGAVGYIATRYLVSKLAFERIGFIETPVVPDFTALEDYGLALPHEVFIDRDRKVVVLLNRVNPDKRYMNSFVDAVMELVSKLGIEEAILIGGLDAKYREGSEEFRWLRTSRCTRELEAPLFMKGPYIVGPLASLLIAFELRGLPAIALFPYTEPERVDHRAAAKALEILGRIIGIEIDVSELISFAEYVEKIEKEVIEQSMTAAQRRESVMYM